MMFIRCNTSRLLVSFRTPKPRWNILQHSRTLSRPPSTISGRGGLDGSSMLARVVTADSYYGDIGCFDAFKSQYDTDLSCCLIGTHFGSVDWYDWESYLPYDTTPLSVLHLQSRPGAGRGKPPCAPGGFGKGTGGIPNSPRRVRPPPPFHRPNPLPSLTSRPNDSLLSTLGAASGHPGPRRSTKNPVVHSTAQAFARHSCPALPPPPPRDHHPAPHRPGEPGELSGPGQ